MFCRNCGKEVAEGAKFCGVCGAAQNAGVSGVKNNKKNNIAMGVTLGIVLLVLGVLIIKMASGNDISDSPADISNSSYSTVTKVQCAPCSGMGRVKCTSCLGSGTETVIDSWGPENDWFGEKIPCRLCKGAKTLPCDYCDGTGWR